MKIPAAISLHGLNGSFRISYPPTLCPPSTGIWIGCRSTPTVKLTEAALLALAPEARPAPAEPLDGHQRIVADLWRTLLKVDHIRADDDFSRWADIL